MARKKRKTIKGHLGQQGTCVNTNCDEVRHVVKISEPGIPTYRSVCKHCHEVNYGMINPKTGKPKKYKSGVIRVKKNHCQNNFDTSQNCGDILCRTEHDPDGTLPSRMLDDDHIDGDHNNNISDNMQTLCKACHAEKSKLNGDHKSKGGNLFLGYAKDTKQSILITPYKPIDHNFF